MEGFYSSSATLRKRKDYSNLRAAINDTKSQLGICSFSEIYDHELMWAHYANQFQGICIAYSLSGLLSNLSGDASFVRMFYNERAPVMHSTDNDCDELARRALSSKSYRWLYEREWRLFAPQGQTRYKRPNVVKCVYLGSRIESDAEHRVRAQLARLKIPVCAMAISKYSIEFEPRA
jgi:hypothetical protein